MPALKRIYAPRLEGTSNLNVIVRIPLKSTIDSSIDCTQNSPCMCSRLNDTNTTHTPLAEHTDRSQSESHESESALAGVRRRCPRTSLLSLVFLFLFFYLFFHNISYHSLHVKLTHSLFLAKLQLQTKQQITDNRSLVRVNLPVLRTVALSFSVRDNPSPP